MSAFVRTKTAGTWTGALLPANLTDLGAKARKAISGLGGAYLGPVTFSTSDQDNPITLGDLVCKKGSTAQLAAAQTITLTGSTYPTFSTPETHKILQALAPFSSPSPEYLNFNCDSKWGAGVQAVALSVRRSDGTIDDMSFVTPLRTHDKATLGKVTFRFTVPTIRKEDVFRKPRFRIVRVNDDGVIEPLKSTEADELGITADADGFIEPTAGVTPAAWGEQTHEVVYLCDQNNVIDAAEYAYQIEILEERFDPKKELDDGLFVYRAIDARFAVDYAHSAQAPSGVPVSIDGVTPASGDVALYVHFPLGDVHGGLWTVVAGDWTRAPSMSSLVDFRDRMLIFVKEGTRNGNTLYQGRYLAKPEADSDGIIAYLVVNCPGESFGNIYHSAALEYSVSTYCPQ